jgi:putative ABC transport system permease protein
MRKRRELSTLRLLGFSRVSITTFPIVQAALISVLGCLLAGAFSEGVSAALNTAFSDRVLEGERVCRLLLQHHLAAFALTLSLALAASAAGGLMASRVTPAEGLRDE